MTFEYTLDLIAAEDPYPTYRWMRDSDPAHYSGIEDIWVLTRYEDVAEAFRDWKTWSSARRLPLSPTATASNLIWLATAGCYP